MVARGERGAAVIELVLLMPILVLLLELVVVGGRVGATEHDMTSVAHEGARAASVAATFHTAETRSDGAVAAALVRHGYRCRSVRASVVSSGAEFADRDRVSVRVSCDVPLADLGIVGLPGVTTVTATSTASLDPYRSVTDR